MQKGIGRAPLPMTNDEALRDRFVAIARTCHRMPKVFYKARYSEATPYRAFLNSVREAMEVSAGRALPDALAFLGEMARVLVIEAGAEQPRDLRDALREEAVSDAACDALEMEVAIAPTLANVEALIERSRELERKTHAKLQALMQTRDALMDRNHRRAA